MSTEFLQFQVISGWGVQSLKVIILGVPQPEKVENHCCIQIISETKYFCQFQLIFQTVELLGLYVQVCQYFRPQLYVGWVHHRPTSPHKVFGRFMQQYSTSDQNNKSTFSICVEISTSFKLQGLQAVWLA